MKRPKTTSVKRELAKLDRLIARWRELSIDYPSMNSGLVRLLEQRAELANTIGRKRGHPRD
jgi:chorismate mutase